MWEADSHVWMDTWFMTKFAEQSSEKRMGFSLNGTGSTEYPHGRKWGL